MASHTIVLVCVFFNRIIIGLKENLKFVDYYSVRFYSCICDNYISICLPALSYNEYVCKHVGGREGARGYVDFLIHLEHCVIHH